MAYRNWLLLDTCYNPLRYRRLPVACWNRRRPPSRRYCTLLNTLATTYSHRPAPGAERSNNGF
jgi:hypothetical protein